MIYGNISQAGNYLGLGRGIRIGLEYLIKGEFADLEAGKKELKEGAYAMCNVLELKEKGLWEAHRRYLDIHFCLEEGETISCVEIDRVENWGDYDEEKDCMLAPGLEEGVKIPMKPGDFVIVFPEDAHMPGVAAGEKNTLSKIIIKIPVEV